AVETAAALDGAVDVVVRDGGLLRLLDGVVERGVARRVRTTHAGRDLDVLDQLGEQLAAPGIDDGLLVLRGRPLGMPCHLSPPDSAAVRRRIAAPFSGQAARGGAGQAEGPGPRSSLSCARRAP